MISRQRDVEIVVEKDQSKDGRQIETALTEKGTNSVFRSSRRCLRVDWGNGMVGSKVYGVASPKGRPALNFP